MVLNMEANSMVRPDEKWEPSPKHLRTKKIIFGTHHAHRRGTAYRRAEKRSFIQ